MAPLMVSTTTGAGAETAAGRKRARRSARKVRMLYQYRPFLVLALTRAKQHSTQRRGGAQRTQRKARSKQSDYLSSKTRGTGRYSTQTPKHARDLMKKSRGEGFAAHRVRPRIPLRTL